MDKEYVGPSLPLLSSHDKLLLSRNVSRRFDANDISIVSSISTFLRTEIRNPKTMPPPPVDDGGGSGGRASSACVYILSFLFFLVTITGGAFLLLYITLPETENTMWFPIAGMVLVGIPWVFWTITSIYRIISTFCCYGNEPVSLTQQRSLSSVPVSPVAVQAEELVVDGEAGENSPVGESPGGGGSRKVRFGEATVMGETEGNRKGNGDGGGGGGGAAESPLSSHESEKPLAFSMSS